MSRRRTSALRRASKKLYFGITGLGPLGRLELGSLDEPTSLGVLTSSLYTQFMEIVLPTRLAPRLNAGFTFGDELLDSKVGDFNARFDARPETHWGDRWIGRARSAARGLATSRLV